MIFILCPLCNFSWLRANLERQGAPKMLIREYIMYACTLVQTAPLLSKPRDKAMVSFRRECWSLVDLYLGVSDWKVQKAHRLSARSPFMYKSWRLLL